MYGIGVVKFGDKTVGYIEKGSWDWGGAKPEKVDVEAEQVPGAPVLTLVTKNGTIAPRSTSYSWTTRTSNSPLVERLSARKEPIPVGKPRPTLWNSVTSVRFS